MKIFSANNPPQAHIVCDLLRSQGIDCEVRGEALFSAYGEIPMGDETAPHVWLLNPLQEKVARGAVKEFEASIDEAQREAPWICAHCGEHNEAQFGLCWSCSEAAPS